MSSFKIFAPQWQGSGLSKEIYYGACALKEYVELEGLCTLVDIDIDVVHSPKLKNDMVGYDLIIRQLKAIEELLYEYRPNKTFTIGGGCGVEIPIVSYLKERHKDITLFWFDAHGDLNSPMSSRSKLFHGMPLRFLTDELENLDIRINKIPTKDVNLLGVRDLDEPEKRYISSNCINLIQVDTLKNGILYDVEVGEMPRNAYIHIDLDVLDPKVYSHVKCPTKNGLSIKDLEKAIQAILNQFEVVGISIVENTAVSLEEIKKLHHIIEMGAIL